MCVWTHFSCMYTPQTMQMSPGSTNHKIVHLSYPPRRQTKENHEKSTRNHYSVELQTACERNDSGWAINKSCCQLNVDAWIGGGWMYYTYTIEVGWSGMLPVVTSDILRIACNCFGHTKARRGSLAPHFIAKNRRTSNHTVENEYVRSTPQKMCAGKHCSNWANECVRVQCGLKTSA